MDKWQAKPEISLRVEDMNPATAPRYTHGHHAAVLASHQRRDVANSAAYLAQWLTGSESILDIGCGPGSLSVDLARHVPDGLVLGIDTGAEVLGVAEHEAKQAGLSNISFAQADVYALPFAEGAFDVVHAHQVLQHLPEPAAALREMARVTRHGGVVAVRDADYGAMTWYPDNPGLARWNQLYREQAKANRGQPDAGRRMLSWLLQAGFDPGDVALSTSTWSFCTPADRIWWASTWAARMTDSSIANQLVAEGRASVDELDEIARAWSGWAASPDGWFAVPHTEALVSVH